MKYGKILFSFIFLIALFISVTTFVKSQTCNNPDECNRLIEDYNNQIQKLQGQGNTLKNQIAQFDAQIKLTSLKITQTEEQISLLSGRIDQIQGSLGSLTKAFNERAVETYKMAKVSDPLLLLISSDSLSEAFDRFSYLKKIQEGDRNLIDRLKTAQVTYETEKSDQEDLQKQLEIQKQNLASQKAAKAQLLAITKNDEKSYHTLLAKATDQLNRFRNYANSLGGASLLQNQTKCNEGWNGCYYNQRDSLWGDMFLGLSSFKMKDSGCFVTSVAMLASHNNKNIKPNDIAALPDAFSGGDVSHDFRVKDVRVQINNADASSLDSLLSSGNMVMAQLYGGVNQHFIVILRKEAGTYIMNDPFLPDGYNKPLSAGKHTISDIKSLRLVSFN